MNTIKGKIIIEGIIEVVTGLHIGTSGDFSAIGAVDNIVIRDMVTKKPMIPGSSLKGKMRYLLSRTKYSETSLTLDDVKNENICIKRLFGSTNPVMSSRLQFQDMVISEESINKFDHVEFDLPFTEVKYENTINRATGEAMPRQQERVPAGSEFNLKLVYDIENIDELKEDFENISLMMDVLQDDYLGGHGTRGYGRIKFKNLELKVKTYTEENKKLKPEIESILEEFRNEWK